MALLKQQQPHFPQHLDIGHGLFRILGGPDQHEVFPEQRHLREGGFRHRQGDDGGIKPAFGHLADELRRQRLADMNVEPRMQAGEMADESGQQIGRDGRDDAKPEPARHELLRGTGEVAQFIDRAQDVPDARGKRLAKAGEAHLAGAPLEQRGSQRVLQIADLQRQGGLRHGASFRRPAEMPVKCQGLEIAELAQGQIVHRKYLSVQSENTTIANRKHGLQRLPGTKALPPRGGATYIGR